MKNLILILLIFYGLVLQGITQVPEKMVFQLTLTSNQDEIFPDRPVGIRIQIKQGSEFGAAVFVEAYSSETNSNGLVTLEIGGGTAILGSFAEINWTKGPFFIQTEADLSGGTNYTITGTGQLVAVPYALHVNTADSIRRIIPEADPAFNASLAKNISAADTASWNNKLEFESQDLAAVLSSNNDGRGMQLKNAEIPVHPQDMATKAYVDALESKLDDLENLLVNAGLYDVKDVEGNLYHALKVGNQIWMKENLRTTKYNDGNDIPYAVISGSRYPDTATYCWLGNNQAAYGSTYGPLYNYYTVETGKLCPDDWHVPVKAEWDALAEALGGDDIAGGKMKEAGTLHWTAPNTAATNESGFTALPGGELSTYSSHGGTGFQNYRVVACWWSASTEEGIATAYYNSCIHGSLTHFTRDKSYAVSVRCIRGEYPDIRPPVVTTSMVTEIFQNTATSGGVITDDGGSAIIARGICWSTLPNPDINSFRPNGIHTYDGYGPGEFTSQITGLTKQRTYYVRAYAVTKTDTVYGNVQTFVPQLAYDSITDIDGNTYKTIEIGTQTWMAENLKVTRYSNGDAIATPLSLSAQNNGAYSNYGNDTSIAAVYGRLYNWYTTVDPRGLCPSGWHVPDFEDWSDLIFGLGSYQIAGIKLKETGTSHWINNTGTETNESGFTALPGGWWNGAFSGSGTHAYFWSSTILDGKPYHWMIHDDIIDMSESLGAREDGCSVRCIKD